MIRGDIKNPFKIIKNLANTARQQGAKTLRIEGTIANEKLLEVLSKRFGARTDGANEVIELSLEKLSR